MPKVSVIIPCYNIGQYLDEAVDSVLAQTFQDFEIIIVNDGSTDEFTNKLLANYTKPKTRVLNTGNQGLPSARNNGIEISSGEYICCLDADDKYHPEFLEKSVAVLDADKNKEYGFVTTWIQCFGDNNEIWKTSDYNPFRLAVMNLIHVASLFRRTCWIDRQYSTNLSGYQDWDFWIAIVSLGYKWTCINEPLFYYRIRKGSMVSESDKKRLSLIRTIIDNNESFYGKNWKKILIEAQGLIQEKNDAINAMQNTINAMQNTYSWKITSPLRWFRKLIGY